MIVRQLSLDLRFKFIYEFKSIIDSQKKDSFIDNHLFVYLHENIHDSGEKQFKLEEVLPMVSTLKKEIKDMGCYEDFIECLKLYDKRSDNKMLAGELTHAFRSLGEYKLLYFSLLLIIN